MVPCAISATCATVKLGSSAIGATSDGSWRFPAKRNDERRDEAGEDIFDGAGDAFFGEARARLLVGLDNWLAESDKLLLLFWLDSAEAFAGEL